MAKCRVVHTKYGPIRVQGGKVDQQDLERIVLDVIELIENECGHIGPIPMPEIAQRMHDRETYTCGLVKGHSGQHEWHGRKWDNA